MLLGISFLVGWTGFSLALAGAKEWSFKNLMLGNWAVPAYMDSLPPGSAQTPGGPYVPAKPGPNVPPHWMVPVNPNMPGGQQA